MVALAVIVWRLVSYLLGRLAATFADWDRAESHYRRSIDDCRQAEMMPSMMLTCAGYAAALEGRASPGDMERAKSLRAEARALAEALGIDSPLVPV